MTNPEKNIPEKLPDDMEGRSDQRGWNHARELVALCNGSAPTREQIVAIVGEPVQFEHSSHVTRALIHIEHAEDTPRKVRQSISQLIQDFVMIETRD